MKTDTLNMFDPKILELPEFTDVRGKLSLVSGGNGIIPFEIKRCYWIYDVPEVAQRAGHAHKRVKQLLIAISGSFVVTLDNGEEKKEFQLDKPCAALLVEPPLWISIDRFSKGAVCLVIASEEFDETDYIRDYEEFVRYVKDQNNIAFQ